jgi:hypothetical protein
MELLAQQSGQAHEGGVVVAANMDRLLGDTLPPAVV